jgi:glutamyl-Q tRNA(Asp) synthetase
LTYRGRFAPSPTGPLHFGSLVAAVASWLDARAAGGEWLVRIEDLDRPRNVPGAAGEILRSLERLGLEWDGEIVRQSERAPLYEAALDRLRAMGLVYRCRCSRREIADSAIHGIEGAIYPGTCRELRLPRTVPGADRVRAPDASIAFEDRVQGPIVQDVAHEIGDFVLKRRDGLHAYQLAVVVDDAAQGITDVVRGADLLGSTPRQIALQQWLGYPQPRYLHVPVAANARGEKLSKQTHAAAIDALAPHEALARAFAFLGQPPAEPAAPREMLGAAIAAWQPALIASRLAIVLDAAPA